jgi:chemotaxis protein histidine kinase CheA
MESQISGIFNVDPALSNPGLKRQGACFDFDDMNAICADYEKRIVNLEAERDAVESALADATVKAARMDRGQSRFDELEKRAGLAESERDKLKALARDYKERLEHLTEERTELQAKLKQAHERVAELMGTANELGRARLKIQDLESEVEKLRGVIATLASEPVKTEPVKQEPAKVLQMTIPAPQPKAAPKPAPAPIAAAAAELVQAQAKPKPKTIAQQLEPQRTKAVPPPVPMDDEESSRPQPKAKRRSLRSRRR